jgi:hypothetical protein
MCCLVTLACVFMDPVGICGRGLTNPEQGKVETKVMNLKVRRTRHVVKHTEIREHFNRPLAGSPCRSIYSVSCNIPSFYCRHFFVLYSASSYEFLGIKNNGTWFELNSNSTSFSPFLKPSQ